MKRTALILVTLVWPLILYSQGRFQNLDFEAGSFSGWTGFADNTPHNLPYPGIVVVDSSGGFVLEGTYTAFLQASEAAFSLAIAQMGKIPDDAQSIHFLEFDTPGDRVFLSVAGQPLPTVRQYNPERGIYMSAADISAFAGQTVEVRFGVDRAGAFLDAISFSATPVPEPSVMLLWLSTGIVGLFCCTHRPSSR